MCQSKIQDFNFYTTLFSLQLHGLDVVLGMQWLEPLVCNWKNMTMEFEINSWSFIIKAQWYLPEWMTCKIWNMKFKLAGAAVTLQSHIEKR
jgi:hypothetical protein